MEAKDSNAQNAAELSTFVQNLLQQMQGRFQKMSENIMGRLDDMGAKIDELEKSVAEIAEQSPVEDSVGAQKS